MSSFTPLVTRERYAQMVGVSVDVVAGWISRGYVPVVGVGKYNLVNIALINQQALGASPSVGAIPLAKQPSSSTRAKVGGVRAA